MPDDKKMTPDELAGRIDLTLLRPDVTREEVKGFLVAAKRYPFATVCIPPVFVGAAVEALKETSIKVSTVVGFPLGFGTPVTKIVEAKEAAEAGALELDMVLNISTLKSGDDLAVINEILAIRAVAPETELKVIIECCYLTDEEKVRATECVIKGGAQFVKTSTGFGAGGATIKDVRLLTEATKGVIKVKAAGGIRTLEDALMMLDAGADRIGTSAGVEIVSLREGGCCVDRVTK